MKNSNLDNAYNRYNLEAKSRQAFKVGSDLEAVKKNFQTYRPNIASSSHAMFWISIAITLSYVISQIYLMTNQ